MSIFQIKNGDEENKNFKFKRRSKYLLPYQVGGKKNRVYGEIDLKELIWRSTRKDCD